MSLFDNCTNITIFDNGSDCFSYEYNFTDCEAGYFGPDNPMSSVFFHAIVYSMYCPLLIVAILGNGAVCFLVSSSPRMQTVTNFFITNLAIGDLLMAAFCIPFTFMPLFILYYWPFGGTLCTIVNYSQAVSVFVSAYTLMAISIDRYMAILWPLRPRMTKRCAALIIFVVWLFALITALPIAVVSGLTQPSPWHVNCNRYVCTEDWPTREQNDNYSIALMVLQFIIPVIVLIYTYTSIAIVVWCNRIPGEAENSRDQRFARSKRKMIKMMLAVVVVFTLCWLPFNIIVVMTYSNMAVKIPGLGYIWLVLHWLAMSHSCYNPIIYCFMNSRFRSGFLQMLASIPCCERIVALATRSQRTSVALGMAGSDSTENTLLHRVNTTSTYMTVRHKASTYQHPVRSTSMGMYSNKMSQRTRSSSKNILEDQI